ncbi:hypothetical protein D3C76_1238560 [compost metagenome]
MASRPFELGKGLEQIVLPFGGDTDAGITYGEVEPRLRAVTAGGDQERYFSDFGKFDRIAQQVDQYLAKAIHIGFDQRRYVRGKLRLQHYEFVLDILPD